MLLCGLAPMLKCMKSRFNGHPPLGVNATYRGLEYLRDKNRLFQWAPTLGGECYTDSEGQRWAMAVWRFQWAPTLGGECYFVV